MKDLIEALQIFAKYTEAKYPLGCEHGELYVYVSPDDVSTEDVEKLKALNFRPDFTVDGFSSSSFCL